MRPCIEPLEPRNVLSTLGTIETPVPALYSAPATASVYSTDGTVRDYWQIAPALDQTSDASMGQWPGFVGGVWDVINVHSESGTVWETASLHRFVLPHATSVGIGVNDGAVTVYQHALGSLWATTNNGNGWNDWVQLTNLSTAPSNPQEATGPLPLRYLESPEPWAGYQLGDPLPQPVAVAVWGTIAADNGIVSVGWQMNGHRYATVLSTGSREDYEVLGGVFATGDWLEERL